MAGELATDHEIAALARAQYGVAARAHLVELGLTRNEIERRVTNGNLHPYDQLTSRPGWVVESIRLAWRSA